MFFFLSDNDVSKHSPVKSKSKKSQKKDLNTESDVTMTEEPEDGDDSSQTSTLKTAPRRSTKLPGDDDF